MEHEVKMRLYRQLAFVLWTAAIVITSVVLTWSKVSTRYCASSSNAIAVNERNKAIERALAQASETVRDPRHRDQTRACIDVLGELRAREAIPFLIDHAAMREISMKAVTTITPPGESLPCIKALISIGTPVLPRILSSSGVGSAPMSPYLAAYVLENVLGREQALAYVKESIVLSTDGPTKANRMAIYKAVEVYRVADYDPVDGPSY